MSRSRSTRRQFVKKTGVAASAALFSGPLLDALGITGDAFAAVVRPNLKGLTATSPTIVSLKKGIAAMKALPAANPLNWVNFANIHGTTASPTNPLWNTCQHGHWWFLPWHRMYLFYFERAIQKLSGDLSFALPFWDYTDPTQRAIPSMYRTPTSGNVLFIPQRNATLNAGGQLPASAVNTSVAFGFTNFTGPTGTASSFGSQQLNAPNHGAGPHGRLETTPHDSIHVSIGGFMGAFETAAQDPLFWAHHANIDRLWDVWLTMGGGRRDPNNTTWCNQAFRFPDARATTQGATVSKQVKGVINALAQLGYSYQGVPAVPTQSCPSTSLGTVTATDLSKTTILTGTGRQELREIPTAVRIPVARQSATRALQARALVLRIEGIEVSAPPGVIYEVYVSLPAGTAADPSLPNYVGNLAPFGAEMHPGEFTAAFRVSDQVKKIITANGGNIDVTFVPRGPIDVSGREVLKLEGRVTFARARLVEE